MNVFDVPIELRLVHRTVHEWLRHLRLQLQAPPVRSRVHFVYFSCRRDFPYLCLSLRSLLANVDAALVAGINLFQDAKDPFSDEELSSLRGLTPLLSVRKIFNFSWASPETTQAEIGAFTAVAGNAAPEDYVAKVDSDILFIGDAKILEILHANPPFAGDGHFSYYGYAQGGLYFLRARETLSALGTLSLADIAACSQSIDNNGEDRVISELMRRAGHRCHFTRLMLFPNEYRRLSRLNRFVRWDFCAAHFVRDKERMQEFCDRVGVPLQPAGIPRV